MRRLQLAEHSARAYAPVSPAVADALAGTKAVKVSVDRWGRTILRSSSYVGVVQVGDVELRVNPKIGVRRLLWLLGDAQSPRGWREDDVVNLAEADDLISTVAVSFLVAARRAIAAGVLRGYRVTEEATTILRGRLREADQLRGRLGLAVPLEVRYDDYTVDIPENRLLRFAALLLLSAPGVPASTRAGLRKLLSTLVDVSPFVPADQSPATTDNRLNRHYQPALRLSRLVLAGRGIEQPPGLVQASGFLFDLNRAFQNWLTAAVARALAPVGGRLHDEYRTYLDGDRRIAIRPDLVWVRGGRPAAVLDAKYKTLTLSKHPRGDVYQMLSYCTALGLPAGHLVYAAGDAEQVQHVVRYAGTTIQVWALDLSQPIPLLVAQVGRLADAVMHAPSTS